MQYVVLCTSFASRLHHHTTTDGVEWVGRKTSDGSYALSDHPADKNVCILGVWKHTCKRHEPLICLKGNKFTKKRGT